jgi:hypothetical protein
MQRPVGVTIIEILYFLGAALCVLIGVGIMLGGGLFASLLSQQGQGGAAGAGFLAGLGVALGVIVLVLAVIPVLTGWGLWKLKSWARILAIVFAVLGLLGALFGLLGAFSHPGLLVSVVIRLVIHGLILWYMFQPDVKAAFGSA